MGNVAAPLQPGNCVAVAGADEYYYDDDGVAVGEYVGAVAADVLMANDAGYDFVSPIDDINLEIVGMFGSVSVVALLTVEVAFVVPSDHPGNHCSHCCIHGMGHAVVVVVGDRNY